MASLFVRLALLIDTFSAADPTTDVRTHTCRFDGGNGQCNVLKQQPRSRSLSVITVKYTITSIMKGIWKLDKPTNVNVLPLSSSGSKSVLHRFV